MIGNHHAELALLIALAAECDKSAIALRAQVKKRTRCCNQRWSLVVLSVEGAEGPIKAGNSERCAEARADGALRKALHAGKMRRTHPCRKREPRKWLELVVDKKCSQAAGRIFQIAERWIAAAIVEYGAELLTVPLIKAVEARLEIIFCEIRAEADLPAGVSR